MQNDSASWDITGDGEGVVAPGQADRSPVAEVVDLSSWRASSADAVAAQVARLHANFSTEITPREAERVDLLARVLPPGTRVYITHLPAPGLDGSAQAARALSDVGLTPVPHIAVRSLTGLLEAEAALRRMSEESGVTEVLVIAGGLASQGPLTSTMELLDTGVMARHGITTIGVAGHPEGSPDIAPDDLVVAVQQKNAYAAETQTTMRLVTQFTFDPGATIAWEQRLREAGNRLPIHVGLPGAASVQKLLKYGISCGIGPSLAVLKKQSRKVLKLVTPTAHYPDATVLGIAKAMAADPAALFEAAHYFPFGALEPTLTWAAELRAGDFVIDRRDRLISPSRKS